MNYDWGPLPRETSVEESRRCRDADARRELEDFLMQWRVSYQLTSAEFLAWTSESICSYTRSLVTIERKPKQESK